MLYREEHRSYASQTHEQRYAGLVWRQTHDGWLSRLSDSVVLAEETENIPGAPHTSHSITGIEKMRSLQTVRNTLPRDIRLELGILKPRPREPFLTVPSSSSCSSSPSTCTKEPSPPLTGLFLLHYSQLLLAFGDHGQRTEEKVMHRESLLAEFALFWCYPWTPLSDPLSVTAEVKTGRNEISDSPHHTATAQQRQGQTKLWTQMLRICPNYYYGPSRGRKIPVLRPLSAWMPPWEVLLLNLAPSGWSQAEKALLCSAGWPANALHSA